MNKNKVIQSWQGTNSLTYKNGKNITFEKNTIIWDKEETRWVFYYGKPYNACFSTVVVNASEYLECLLVDNEKVSYHFM